jgi:uncharacterized protein
MGRWSASGSGAGDEIRRSRCVKIVRRQVHLKERWMFIVELAFDASPQRIQARPAHRERLQQLKAQGKLVMAGPYADDSGAVLVFDVAELDQLQQLLADDPYYRTAGVTVVRLSEWTPIIR